MTGGPGLRRRPSQPLAAGLVIIACVLIAAHFLRADMRVVALCCAAAPALLFVRRRWAPAIVRLMLFAATVEWLRTAAVLAHDRIAAGRSWHRMAAILVAVAGVTLWSAFVAPRASREGCPPDAGS